MGGRWTYERRLVRVSSCRSVRAGSCRCAGVDIYGVFGLPPMRKGPDQPPPPSEDRGSGRWHGGGNLSHRLLTPLRRLPHSPLGGGTGVNRGFCWIRRGSRGRPLSKPDAQKQQEWTCAPAAGASPQASRPFRCHFKLSKNCKVAAWQTTIYGLETVSDQVVALPLSGQPVVLTLPFPSGVSRT